MKKQLKSQAGGVTGNGGMREGAVSGGPARGQTISLNQNDLNENQQKKGCKHKGKAAELALLPRLHGRAHGHAGKSLISICNVTIFRKRRKPGFDVLRTDQTLFVQRFGQIAGAQHMRPGVVGTHCFRAPCRSFPVIDKGNQFRHRLGIFRHMDDGVARMR